VEKGGLRQEIPGSAAGHAASFCSVLFAPHPALNLFRSRSPAAWPFPVARGSRAGVDTFCGALFGPDDRGRIRRDGNVAFPILNALILVPGICPGIGALDVIYAGGRRFSVSFRFFSVPARFRRPARAAATLLQSHFGGIEVTANMENRSARLAAFSQPIWARWVRRRCRKQEDCHAEPRAHEVSRSVCHRRKTRPQDIARPAKEGAVFCLRCCGCDYSP